MSSLLSSLFESLHQTLANEIKDYRQLITLTQLEHVALQDGNLSDLLATTQNKENLLIKLAQWEQIRTRIMANLAEQLRMPSPSLTDLITCCNETVGQTLSALHQEFVTLVEQLRTLNQNNHLLLQTEMVRVNAILNFVFSTIAPGGQYSVNGSSQTTQQSLAGKVLNWQI